jgi:hypothetical protein
MGLLKKIFKGVKKVFKKIGKAIKRTFKKIGKFMGKLGIIGQIGLSFLLPGVGGLLGKAATALGGSSSALFQGIGKVLQTAVNFGKTAGKVFSSVTDAVGGFVKEVGGGFLSKMGVSDATLTKFGMNPEGGFQSWMDGVGKSVGAVRESAAGILDPWKTDAAGLDFHERSLAEIAAKKGELKPVSIDPTKDPMDPQYQQTKPKTYTQQYSKDPMSPEYDPVEATEAVIEETAKAATEQNESFFGQLAKNTKDRFVSDITQVGSNYLMQATGLMPQTQQVQTASGGLAYTGGVDYSLQSNPFMSTFNQGMVNTNYNALFDQIYSYQPRGYA